MINWDNVAFLVLLAAVGALGLFAFATMLGWV